MDREALYCETELTLAIVFAIMGAGENFDSIPEGAGHTEHRHQGSE